MSGPNPFSARAALALLLGGGALLLALLWMLGSGLNGGLGGEALNDGGAHAAGKGLTGYAGLARLMEAAGYHTSLAQDDTALSAPGLLVLTPPQQAGGADIAHIVAAHRKIGPVLVIAPKWLAAAAPEGEQGAKRGWVRLLGTQAPNWPGFLDDARVAIAPGAGPTAGRWYAATGLSGTLPNPAQPEPVETGGGGKLVPLVWTSGQDYLAAYLDDAGRYPALDAMAGIAAKNARATADGPSLYPLVIVFEPDLLDNAGLAHPENAALAEALVQAASAGAPRHIIFDLTLNGLARQANLLTLAFTPPYLAATLCLLLAALVVLWRGSLRFGAPLAATRAIAFGKAALVGNAAGLIARSGRLHLLPLPYASAARERLVRALGLPRLADAAASEGAIDRALASRTPGTLDSDWPSFTATTQELTSARKQATILAAAAQLHALERTLTQ